LKALNVKERFHKELDVIYGKDEVQSFFFLASAHFFNMTRMQLALEPELTLTSPEVETLLAVVEDLKQQKPIQYILGDTEFYGLKFKVNASVLIPRPETEELVDWIIRDSTNQGFDLEEKTELKILDIGTGSGCIAISLAKHLPRAQVYALDVSDQALKVAMGNADLNNVKVEFITADILNSVGSPELPSISQFDVIVSNPPYVRHMEKAEMKSNVLDNEPHLALFVDDDNPLVFYRSITDFAVKNLKEKGCLYFEINQYLGADSRQLLVDAGFQDIELRKDINGNDRMLKGIKN